MSFVTPGGAEGSVMLYAVGTDAGAKIPMELVGIEPGAVPAVRYSAPAPEPAAMKEGAVWFAVKTLAAASVAIGEKAPPALESSPTPEELAAKTAVVDEPTVGVMES